MPTEARKFADAIVGAITDESTPENEAFAWRHRGVERCLKCLAQQNASFADRGVLLRELVRLAGGFAVVPSSNAGIPSDKLPALKRFGLQASEPTKGTLHLALQDNRALREELPESLRVIMSLDPQSRRLQDPVLGDAILMRTTGYEHYTTATQKAAVRALVTMPPAATMIVTMPTGTGKSLLFQMGTRWWRETSDHERPVAVVIVPTVALALDQERSTRAIPGLESSRALTGSHARTVRDEILQSFVRGEVPILFLSPELALNNWNELMMAARPLQEKPSAAKGRLHALFIDEAHIIESWGRTFRPDFQRLSGLVAALRAVNSSLRCILLSATIDDGAREVLRKSYGNDGPFLEIDSQVPRYEFDISVHRSTSAEDRDELVLSALDFIPRPCIVYTTLIKTANSLHDRLRKREFSRIELFTGEVSDSEERARVVDRWAKDEIDLIVATSAFGMGVDKANVRAIVHCCVPESPSRYYQELGRAARDGHQAMAACFWWTKTAGHPTSSKRDDLQTARSFATSDWLTLELAMPRWKAMLDAARRLRRFDRDSKTGEPVVRIPLDAARRGLGPVTGEPNRRWNMSLLNLLQRAGAIQVLAVNEDVKREPSWTIRIAKSQLLQEGQHGQEYFQELFDLREQEQQSAGQEVSGFEKLLDGRADDCLLAGVFELIETGRPVVAECGRCDWCRVQNVAPPTRVRFGGARSVWQATVTGTCSRLVPGLTIVHPEDPSYEKGLPTLIGRLVGVGVDQFVVPDGLGKRCVQFLSNSQARLGFVLETGECFRQEWAFAELSCAILLPFGAHAETRKRLLEMAKIWLQNANHRHLVLVAAPGEQVDGRPLSQIASKLAPYDEDALEKLGALQ